jgi:hypothetical protein
MEGKGALAYYVTYRQLPLNTLSNKTHSVFDGMAPKLLFFESEKIEKTGVWLPRHCRNPKLME